MTDIKKYGLCIEVNCEKRASYNIPGNKAIYFKTHKKINMVNVAVRKCKFINCNKQPTHNLINETKALYCSKHKQDNMINITHSKCAQEGCSKIPIYNIPGTKKGKFCFKHKTNEMIDVKNKTCIKVGCLTTACRYYPL
jgi:hypothetical protein